jgi:nucleoid-associated protein YgaU
VRPLEIGGARRPPKPEAPWLRASPTPQPAESLTPASAEARPSALERTAVRARSHTGGACLAEMDGANVIFFDFDPESLTISHTAPGDPAGGTKQNKEKGEEKDGMAQYLLTPEEAAKAQGIATVTISNLVFDGKGVQETCDQLLYWSYPVANAAGREPGKEHVPLLKFRWGSFVLTGMMHSVTVTYRRFSSRGTPTRASVNLTIYQATVPRPRTNPTSGGLPGRRTHVMTSGECLQAVATASYGTPGDWRPLAEANRIDDPLRVRPGAVLYLPGPGELARPAVER